MPTLGEWLVVDGVVRSAAGDHRLEAVALADGRAAFRGTKGDCVVWEACLSAESVRALGWLLTGRLPDAAEPRPSGEESDSDG